MTSLPWGKNKTKQNKTKVCQVVKLSSHTVLFRLEFFLIHLWGRWVLRFLLPDGPPEDKH